MQGLTEMRWRVRESRISEMMTVWWMAFCMLSYHMLLLLLLLTLRMSRPASRSSDSLLPSTAPCTPLSTDWYMHNDKQAHACLRCPSLQMGWLHASHLTEAACRAGTGCATVTSDCQSAGAVAIWLLASVSEQDKRGLLAEPSRQLGRYHVADDILAGIGGY